MNYSLLNTFKKTIALIDPTTQMQAIGIGFIIIVGILLETLSVGLIFPLISLLVDPTAADTITEKLKQFSISIDATDTEILIFLSFTVIILFIIKNAFLLFIAYVQAAFAVNNMFLLSTRMYRFYLQGPYSLHLARNSSDLIKNTREAAGSAFIGSFIGFLTLFSELLLVLALLTLLISIDPATSLLATAILAVGVASFYLLFNKRIKIWGERTLKIDKALLKSLQQGLHSIKEIKVLGREEFVVNDYETPLKEYIGLIKLKQIMSQAPRFWIETLAVTTVMAIVIYTLISGLTAASVLPLLTVFAAAAMRLIPSMNRLLVSLNRINDAQHPVNVIFDDLMLLRGGLNQPDKIQELNLEFTNEITLRDVFFKYENSEATALQSINFSLKKGKSLGIVGASGAGKSTLVDIILGLLQPCQGEVLIDGVDIINGTKAWQQHLGYVPQSIYLIDDTIRQNIALGVKADEIDNEKLNRAIELAHLGNFIQELPEGLETKVNEHGVRLSGGQRQRVGIARALYHNPDVILFDEATSALDGSTEREVSLAIENLSGGKTVIIIAHRLSTVRHCDHLIFLQDGRAVAEGTFDQLYEKNTDFQNMVKLSAL